MRRGKLKANQKTRNRKTSKSETTSRGGPQTPAARAAAATTSALQELEAAREAMARRIADKDAELGAAREQLRSKAQAHAAALGDLQAQVERARSGAEAAQREAAARARRVEAEASAAAQSRGEAHTALAAKAASEATLSDLRCKATHLEESYREVRTRGEQEAESMTEGAARLQASIIWPSSGHQPPRDVGLVAIT